jgi:hypothetical protein
VDLGQGDDLLDMVPHVEAPLGQLRVIRGRPRREREEPQKDPLVPGLSPLVEQCPYMLGIFVITAPVERAHMLRHQRLAIEEPKPVARQLQGRQGGRCAINFTEASRDRTK